MVTEQMKPVLQSKHSPFVCSAIEKVNRQVFCKLSGYQLYIPYPSLLGIIVLVIEFFPLNHLLTINMRILSTMDEC